MQAPFGLSIFSLLLAAAACLECPSCIAQGNTCSGLKLNCSADQDICATIVGEVTTGGQSTTGVLKRCYSNDTCLLLKPGASFEFLEAPVTIKEVTCKAAPSSASFLSALSGLLLLKTFF